MSRKEWTMIFVIAAAGSLLSRHGVQNPFSASLSRSARKMVERAESLPTNAEIDECVDYIRSQRARA